MKVGEVVRRLKARQFNPNARSKVNKNLTKQQVCDIFIEALEEDDQDADIEDSKPWWPDEDLRRRELRNLNKEFPGLMD